MTELKLGKIRMDGGTQPRALLDDDKIDEYAELMREGTVFPDLVVVYDGTNYWLVDGFHRLNAAMVAELETINCDVQPGTLDDAIWLSCSVNATHGVPRTNADKRRAVELALRHKKSSGLTDVQIARHCGVSSVTVGRYRTSIINIVNDTSVKTAIRDGKKYKIDTSNIGRKPADPKPKVEEPAKPEPVVAAPTEPPKQPVGAPTKFPTYQQAWDALSEAKKKQLKCSSGYDIALRAFYEIVTGQKA